jgi:hypothetical protein
MAAQKGIYIYPVKTVSEARTVLEPEFQPDLFDSNHLYVNLDDIRDTSYLKELYFGLGYNIMDNSFEESNGFVKIIFSGHRGSGKSAELRRIDEQLKKPERYFTVFIDLEQEVEVGTFEYADFFSLIIHKLVEELLSGGITKGANRLKALAKRFFQKEVIEGKSKLGSKTSAEGEASAGFSIFGWGAKGTFKQAFSGENETSKTVRQEIKRNTLGLINELNAVLVDVRNDVQETGNGQDILFIIDGSEKVQPIVYEDLFVKNGNIISEISLNMILAVPISAHFQIEKAPYNFNNRFTVPMIKLEKYENATAKMKEIIGNRIDLETFIEHNALDSCIQYSGGCIRQLFQIVHTCLKKSLGSKINDEHVARAKQELGQDLWEYLSSDYLKVVKAGNYKPADKPIGELMYMLILLKYNGNIEINPLLKDYPDFVEWMNK